MSEHKDGRNKNKRAAMKKKKCVTMKGNVAKIVRNIMQIFVLAKWEKA